MRQKRSKEGFRPSKQSPASKQKRTEYLNEYMRKKRSKEGFNLSKQIKPFI